MKSAEHPREVAPLSDREIVISLHIEVPRELVWQAWTEPDRVSQWWGPEDFKATTEEMDVRPGGVWRFTMRGPNGVDSPNFVRYLQVIEPDLLVFTHGDDEEHIFFEVTATFVEENELTTVTLRQLYETTEARDYALEHGWHEGGKQTLARLAEYLEMNL